MSSCGIAGLGMRVSDPSCDLIASRFMPEPQTRALRGYELTPASPMFLVE
jgi:hypothetical protein